MPRFDRDIREWMEQRSPRERRILSANNIGIIPSSTPGNFTVGGVLTVNGGMIKIPVSTYFLRFGDLGVGGKGWSVNKSADTGNRDDPTLGAVTTLFSPDTGRMGGTLADNAGFDQWWHRGGNIGSNTAQGSSITGDTAEHNVYAVGLRQNALQTGGYATFDMKIVLAVVTGVGGGTTIRASDGTTKWVIANVGSSQNLLIMGSVLMGYDSYVGNVKVWTNLTVQGSSPTIAWGAFTWTLSQPNTLYITAQNNNAADAVSGRFMSMEQYNTH